MILAILNLIVSFKNLSNNERLGRLCFALPVWVSAFAAEGERVLTVPIRADVDGTAKLSETFQLYRRSKALIISIDNYTNGWPRLSIAVEDARQVAAALKKQGFRITLKTNLNEFERQSTLETFFVV